MTWAALAQALLTLGILLVFVGFLVWGIRSGQFRDVEAPKYRMLDDDNETETGKGKAEEK